MTNKEIIELYYSCGSMSRAYTKYGLTTNEIRAALFLEGVKTYGTEHLDKDKVRKVCEQHGRLKAASYFNIESKIFLIWCEINNMPRKHKSKLMDLFNSKEDYINLILSSKDYHDACSKEPRLKQFSHRHLSSQNTYYGIHFGGRSELTESELTIMKFIIDNPKMTYAQIGNVFNTSETTVSRVASKASLNNRKGVNSPHAHTNEELKRELHRIFDLTKCLSHDGLLKLSSIYPSVFLKRFGSIEGCYEAINVIPPQNSSTQNLFLNLFENLTSIKLIREFPLSALGITERYYRFDGYNPELRLAIEYDTIDHFLPIEKFGGKDGLKERQQRDKEKDEISKLNNINLVRFRFESDWSKEGILKKLEDSKI